MDPSHVPFTRECGGTMGCFCDECGTAGCLCWCKGGLPGPSPPGGKPPVATCQGTAQQGLKEQLIAHPLTQDHNYVSSVHKSPTHSSTPKEGAALGLVREL